MSALPESVIAHYRSGEFVQADEACAALLEQDPENADAWHLRGILALARREFGAAVTFFASALDGRNDDRDMYVNYGMALLGAGRVDDALDALNSALALDSACPEAHLWRSRCYLASSAFAEAENSVDAALALRPQWPEAMEVKAAIMMRVGRFKEAEMLAISVVRAEPTRSDAYRILADILVRNRAYQKALSRYRTALENDPQNLDALGNLSVALGRLGRYGKAVTIARKALALGPGAPSVRYNLGLSLLAQGQLAEGWTHYRARLQMEGNVLATRPMAAPVLLRKPEAAMRVLAWADQGVGEQIMFASLVPDLVKTGAVMSLECDDRLAPLFQRSFPEVEILPRTSPPHARFSEPLDGQFSLADAAGWFRAQFSDFPAHRGYLRVDPARRDALRTRYRKGRSDRPLVGVSWSTSKDAKISREKSLPLADWAPLLVLPGVTFVSLQYKSSMNEITATEAATGAQIISDPEIDPMIDLDAFAAQVAAMDLVITTSSTTAHMAGALGKAVWTFVPEGFGAMWHWFLLRNDSPWYPSMRLFRQEAAGHWDPVMEAACAALFEQLANWQERP